VLVKRNIKIGEVVSQWDKDGDGTVDKKEFRQRVLALGVKADPSEVDSLFDKLDESGDGELDIEEMKVTLTRLRESCGKGNEDMEAQISKVAKLGKVAKKAQVVADDAMQEFNAKPLEDER